jgi:hypothetical protein
MIAAKHLLRGGRVAQARGLGSLGKARSSALSRLNLEQERVL